MSGEIPPWGCPWHGLIKGGQLELPSGAKIPMRQPSVWLYPWRQSSADLIDLGAPLASENNNDPDVEWRNVALLSGDQIHGVSLVPFEDQFNAGGSWIYQAPDSSNWLVSTTLENSDGADDSVEITLARFGEFFSEREVYVYDVPMPDLSYIQTEIDSIPLPSKINIKSFKIARYCSHPKGVSAIFMVGATAESFNTDGSYPSVAWIKVDLSGNANDCTARIEIIYRGQEVHNSYTLQESPGGIGSIAQPPEGVTLERTSWGAGFLDPSSGCAPYGFNDSVIPSSPSSASAYNINTYSDVLVSVFYDKKGKLIPVTVSVIAENHSSWVESASGSAGVLTIAGELKYDDNDEPFCFNFAPTYKNGSFAWGYTKREHGSFSVQVKIGSSVVYSISGSAEAVYTHSESGPIDNAKPIVKNRSGYSSSNLEYGGIYSESWPGDYRKFTFYPTIDDFYRHRLCRFKTNFDGDGTPQVTVIFTRYSNVLCGISTHDYDNNSYTTDVHVDPIITPLGLHNSTAISYTSPGNDQYILGRASYNPITGELAGSAVNMDPVCWT